ncbi:unnamed protein product [Durusdinium trenchii]|uniref:Helicase ATP-binding domain-containing protein n=1 Tax=Durusdinium trenchii TaxID=1381693 RepID=A0ABP0K4Q7_9DINO
MPEAWKAIYEDSDSDSPRAPGRSERTAPTRVSATTAAPEAPSVAPAVATPAAPALAVLRQRAEARRSPQTSRTKCNRSGRGALGLLEPDSSDSDGLEAGGVELERQCPKRPAEQPEPVGPSTTKRLAVEVPVQVEKQSGLLMQERPSMAQEAAPVPVPAIPVPVVPAVPAVPPAVPPVPEEVKVLERLEAIEASKAVEVEANRGKKSLKSFLGPDEGLAAKWSEGALQLPGVELPEPIASCLRGYQREGVRWLYQRLFMETRGCLLTDEMGLGKTVQVACCLAAGLFAAGSDVGAVLVVCPPTLVRNWARELTRWGPFAVEVLTPHGANRQRVFQRVEAGLTDVVVASRGLLIRSEGPCAAEALLSLRWGCVVVDEVHQAKNPKGQLHKAIVSLHSPRKLGLTGTPLQNSLTDVWTLLRTVEAHEGWELGAFESRFSRPILKGQKRKASAKDLAVREDALKEFQELLARNCLRRTKDDVALMLPGKNDRVVPCPLSHLQRAAYQNLLESPDFQIALGKRELCVCGAGRPCFCGAGPVWRYVHRRQAESKGLEDEWAAADECACRGRKSPKCMALSLIAGSLREWRI